jgi:hypothetical protein
LFRGGKEISDAELQGAVNSSGARGTGLCMRLRCSYHLKIMLDRLKLLQGCLLIQLDQTLEEVGQCRVYLLNGWRGNGRQIAL